MFAVRTKQYCIEHHCYFLSLPLAAFKCVTGWVLNMRTQSSGSVAEPVRMGMLIHVIDLPVLGKRVRWSSIYFICPRALSTLQSSGITACNIHFNTIKLRMLPTWCICIFRTVLTKKTAIFFLSRVNRLRFGAETCAFCEVRDEYLCTIQKKFGL